ncbi:MAG: hypothetical protein ACI85H_001020 [Paracoccaceae bacterium]|jgi:hypothetical protein
MKWAKRRRQGIKETQGFAKKAKIGLLQEIEIYGAWLGILTFCDKDKSINA